MKDEYDFSKAERAKFYQPDAVFSFPVYLEPDVDAFINRLADERDISVPEGGLSMKEMKLGDQEVQEAIAHFVDEARTCAKTPRDDGVLGFAAMLSILSCMLAVGEALTGDKGGTDAARQAFYDEMDDCSWLLPPKGTTHSDEKAIGILKDVRDGLAHTLTMPPYVMLLPNAASDKAQEDKYGEAHLKRWRLVVPDFIDAVEATIDKICRKYAHVDWDPRGKNKKCPRGPVSVLSVRESWEEEIASSGGSTSAVPTSGSTP